VYVDAGSVSATISSATGGNFEKPGDQPGAATTASPTRSTPRREPHRDAERGRRRHIVYTASLTSAAQTPVTVTFANGATITIAAGASSAP
jgi:surface adhesion protein